VPERQRRMEEIVADSLASFRVVVVTGPRQAGKTTLVRRVLGGGGSLARLDDEATLQAAIADPEGFVAYGDAPRAIDEVQRGGDALVRAVKAAVDADSSPGQFLLNGSADFLTVPTLSESLAGRAVFHELWPFTQGEIEGTRDGLLAAAFADSDRLLDIDSPLGSDDYLERICVGGYPEVMSLPARSRRAWFRNYIRTVTQRDITELTGARRAQQLPRLLGLLAANTAGELVATRIHADSGLGSRDTTDDYIGYLQMTYLAHLVPAWSRNLTRKITRHPKVHITDSGLAAHMLGKDPASLRRPDDPARGALVETFVVDELLRQTGFLEEPEVRLHHLRDRDGAEVDIIAEASDGRVVALEVKASRSVNQADARWLAWLRDKISDDFVCGIVLHTGDRAYRLGDRLLAVPMAALWLAD
jgi:predicted AAA+ superfamily ATPase